MQHPSQSTIFGLKLLWHAVVAELVILSLSTSVSTKQQSSGETDVGKVSNNLKNRRRIT
jgi:hypothetical protein